ncbi:MAG: CoA-binding protein, partial [Acidobacteriota bacterium]
MDFRNPPDEVIRKLLETSRTVAVVGLSPRPERPSHRVAAFLIGKGCRVFGVRPGVKHVLGSPCYSRLRDIPEKIDVVDVFRRSEAVPEHAEEAVALGVSVLWLQLGVIHQEAALRAKRAGLTVVMDRC